MTERPVMTIVGPPERQGPTGCGVSARGRGSTSGLDGLRLFEEMLEPVNVVISVLDIAVVHEGAKQWQGGVDAGHEKQPSGPEDLGLHTVCVEVTAEFLAFSKAKGNDLSTPQPDFGFPGLEPGDRWCLCAARWREAFEAGRAPRVILGATHEATLELVDLHDLKRYAIDLA